MEESGRKIAVAVVTRRGCVLVGRRDQAAADAAGLHEFPGGKIERGETPAAAAVREVREETGLEVRIGPMLGTASALSHAGPIEIVFLAAEPLDPHAVPRGGFALSPTRLVADLACPDAYRRFV